jgi:uncharacterized repeat protein (TIGR03803 family)
MKSIPLAKIAGVTILFCLATALAVSAQAFSTLFSFNYKDGTGYGNLVQGTNGNFYGVGGGGQYGEGEVYEITPGGRLRTLYSFCAAGLPCSDGMGPTTLIQAADRNFYGTTVFGGAYGDGTIFKLTLGGEFRVLHNFCPGNQADCPDGRSPWGFVHGFNGKLYGTTTTGGIYDGGTIFEITPAGELNTIYSFCATRGCPDGVGPIALVLAPNGHLYGVTYAGPCTGCGVFFEVTPAGKLKVLYTFLSSGAYPEGIALGADGSFYGTTYYTGCCTLGGIVFKLSPAGNETTLYTFCSRPNCADGELPAGGVAQGTDGNFYGTTVFGGTNDCTSPPFMGCGTIFSITPDGTLTTLYSFCPQTKCLDGKYPGASLMQATNGKFYGTATAGGSIATAGVDPRRGCAFWEGCGTIYSLDVGLGAFIQSNPTFGRIGWQINILGNNLTGTRDVTFNGTPATFTVVSDSYIRATVPTGATTGTILVTMPSAMLSSNVPFQVIP